jgi:antitoxin (DNA-binding transcriptional repressor) of toxin-antitoxin stability system
MTEVSIAEAQERLPELLAAVEQGKTVMIRGDAGRVFLLSAQPPVTVVNPQWAGYPHPGSAKGLIEIHDDFDEPLEELKEYTE